MPDEFYKQVTLEAQRDAETEGVFEAYESARLHLKIILTRPTNGYRSIEMSTAAELTREINELHRAIAIYDKDIEAGGEDAWYAAIAHRGAVQLLKEAQSKERYLGNSVRITRRACGLSQAQLAEKLCVSLQTVKAYEQGNRDINKAGEAIQRRLRDLQFDHTGQYPCKKQ